MRALQLMKFGPVSNLRLVELADPKADPDTAIVKVAAGAISPSDVRNVEGKMEHTTLPRVPGRDYAGTVVRGPAEWMGAEVWGTGGEIGFSIDGSHAELIAVPIASLRRKPKTLSLEQAAAIGITYLAAWVGIVEYARTRSGRNLVGDRRRRRGRQRCHADREVPRCSRLRRRSKSTSFGVGGCTCNRRILRP